MINERTLNEEFWKLFDSIQNRLNWDMSLDTFEIENEALSRDIVKNKSLDVMAEELLSSRKILSFLMIAYRATKYSDVLMHYAMKLGYMVHQNNIEDITKAEGDMVYDDLFYKYEVDKHFELMCDFFTDKVVHKFLGIRNIHPESFIYFSMIVGYLIRGQLLKLELNNQVDVKTKNKKENKDSLYEIILMHSFFD